MKIGSELSELQWVFVVKSASLKGSLTASIWRPLRWRIAVTYHIGQWGIYLSVSMVEPPVQYDFGEKPTTLISLNLQLNKLTKMIKQICVLWHVDVVTAF